MRFSSRRLGGGAFTRPSQTARHGRVVFWQRHKRSIRDRRKSTPSSPSREILRRDTLGHDVFDAARRRYLAEQRSPGSSTVRTHLLTLAELVAKATFNDTNTQAPFDFDSPWYIATCAVDLAVLVGEPDYASRIRRALGDWPASAGRLTSPASECLHEHSRRRVFSVTNA